MAKKQKYEVHIDDVSAVESFTELADALGFINGYIYACESSEDDLGTCNPGVIRLRRA
jgi:hypothetical protein